MQAMHHPLRCCRTVHRIETMGVTNTMIDRYINHVLPSDSTDCFSNHLESLPFALASTTDSLNHRFVYDYPFENTMPQEMALSTPRSSCNTPPNSPRLVDSSLAGVANGLEQVFQKLVHVLERIDAADKSKAEAEAANSGTAEVPQSEEPKEKISPGRASKLGYKTVNEMY